MDQNLINDLEDSYNPSIEELAYEDETKFSDIYFYKAKSYIKEQKARIVIERGATSILCIEPDLSNDPYDLESYFEAKEIKNGFKLKGAIESNALTANKLNFSDTGSIELRILDMPVIRIDIDTKFLYNEIYFISLKDLNNDEDIDFNSLYIINNSTIDNPDLINKNDIEQTPSNSLELLPIPLFNSSKNYSISVNKVTPISKNDLINKDNELHFYMDNDLILFSNIQVFLTYKLDNIGNPTTTTTHDIILGEFDTKKPLDGHVLTRAIPLKISFQNVNESLQFTNEWTKFVLPWDKAKQFLNQTDLEDLLTIKELPRIETIFNNVKIKNFKLTAKWEIINPNITKIPDGINIDNDFHFNNGNAKGIIYQANTAPLEILLFNYNVPNLPNSTKTYLNWLKNTTYGKDTILILEDGTEITINELLLDVSSVKVDIRFYSRLSLDTKDISNVDLSSIEMKNEFMENSVNKFNYTDSNNNINWPLNDEQQEIMLFMKLPDIIYKRLVFYQDIKDKKLFVKFLKHLISFTLNYRLGFPDREYDDKGNPKNDMAKLHQKFEIMGSNPLQVISNEINSFLMLNPWVVKIKEWNYFLKVVTMLSVNIYSIYSINNGVKGDEQIALPYYFEFSTTPTRLPNGLYDYASLQVILKSKYFNLENYNDEQYNGSMYKNNPLNKQVTVETQNLYVQFPFVGNSILESNNIKSAQSYDIEKDENQRYMLYLICSKITDYIKNNNEFDYYMDLLFSINNNFSKLIEPWQKYKTQLLYFDTLENKNIFLLEKEKGGNNGR